MLIVDVVFMQNGLDKKQQRFIPSDVNVKADLHRLKVILKNENVSNSAVITQVEGSLHSNNLKSQKTEIV